MGTDARLDVTGLKLDPNPFTRTPKGAMVRAENVVMDRPGVATSRRGQGPYGDTLSGAPVTALRSVSSYKDRLIVHRDSTISYDSDGAGTWADYAGSYSPRTGHQIRPVEAGGSLFIATTTGIQKLDELTGAWAAAGVPKALDGDVALTGASGFMANNTAVAYRLVWLIEDAQGREIVGAPSGRVTIGNSAGASRDVAHTWYIPTGITTDHRYQLYRSGAAATATDEPNDELQLVKDASPSSGEIAAGLMTFTDSVPDSLRGAFLYTSPSQGNGIADAAERPPLASELALYNGMMIYGDVAGRHRLELTMLEAGSDGVHFTTLTGNTTNLSAIVTGLASTTLLRAGMRAKNANIPATAEILTVDSANQVTLTLAATGTAVGTSIEFQDVVTVAGRDYYAASAESAANREFLVTTGGTPAVNVQATALSLVFVVNQDSGQTLVYAFYQSGFADLPGMLLFEERGIGGSSFSADSSAASSFDPVLPATSDASENRHAVMISKVDEFEAVPLGNLFPLGSADKPVQRIIPLRESALIWKEDGVWRMVGDDPSTVSFTPLDGTLRLVGLETAVRLSNECYAMTNQGAVVVGENSGTRRLNDDIHRTLLRFSAQANFAAQAWAVGYEADRKWILGLPNTAAATSPNTIYALDIDTSQWTEWSLVRSCGAVHQDRLYLGLLAGSRITEERKSLTRSDFADNELDVTIASSTGTLVTVNSTTGISAGWTLVQNLRESVVVDVVSGTVLEVADSLAWTAAAAIAYEPIPIDIEWVPIDGGAPNIVKQFPEMSLYFDVSDFREVTVLFSTDFLTGTDAVGLAPLDGAGGWGSFPWGSLPWGASAQLQQVLRTLVPIEAQQGHWLKVRVQLSQAFRSFSLLGATVQVLGLSERFHGASREISQSPLSNGEGF
jgi:hypothetical protein